MKIINTVRLIITGVLNLYALSFLIPTITTLYHEPSRVGVFMVIVFTMLIWVNISNFYKYREIKRLKEQLKN
jgi:Flp pilus assembly protein TadB